MRKSWRAGRQFRFLAPLVLAVLGTVAVCLPALPVIGGAAAVPVSARYTAAASAQLPAGGVLGDINGDGLSDILAINPGGGLAVYFGDPLGFEGGSGVGTGWTGYTLAAVGPFCGGSNLAGLLAIDPSGRLWYYPNTGGTGYSTFGARTQVGTGWTGYTVAGMTYLNEPGNASGAQGLGVLATDRAGNLWYYPSYGCSGMATLGPRVLVGTGWTGFTVDVAAFTPGAQLLAVDPAGNLWLYPEASGTGTSTFGAPTQVGSGWRGWQAIDAGMMGVYMQSYDAEGLVAIDPAGTLWAFPRTSQLGPQFAAPVKEGTGWTGYRIN